MKASDPLRAATLLAALLLLPGCRAGVSQPDFPPLVPVKGVVVRNGQPVTGGAIRFDPQPESTEFLINSDVASDGSFQLSTVRLTDTSGERRPGAPAGQYVVTFMPPAGDQTAGYVGPIALPEPVAISSSTSSLTVELPASKP